MSVSRLGFLSLLLVFQFVTLKLSYASTSPYWRISASPQWVIKQGAAELDSQSLGSESVDYLVSDTQINLNAKKPHFYRYIRFQVNDSAGVEELSDIHISFNPDFQQLELHHIDIIRDDKRLNRLVSQDLRLVDVEPERHSKLYSGHKQLQLWLKDVRAGDIIDYSFSIVGENPVFAGNFSHVFGLGWGVDVAKASASVMTPVTRPLNHQLMNIQTDVKVESLGDSIRYSVELAPTPAYFEDGQAPSWDVAYPSWQVTSFNTWQEVSHWAEQLFELPHHDSPALKEWLLALQEKPTKLAIEEAIRFSQQDIRYLGVEIAENSHRPHHPASVIENRYGDCKDKSLLLVRALNHLGVEAYPVLVSSYKQQTLGNDLPSYNAFDHAIVYLKYKQNEYWVDPTNASQSTLLDTISPAAFGQALVVSPNNQGLTTIPDYSFNDNQIEVNQTFLAADYRSPVQLSVNTVVTGVEADRVRREFANQSSKRIAKFYLDYYQAIYPAVSVIKPLSFEDDKISNRIEITEQYLVDDFWELAEGKAVFHLFTDSVEHYLKVPQKTNRVQAYSLGRPVTVKHRSRLLLPHDIDFSDLNSERLLEDDYFKLVSRFDYQNRVLTYQQLYQTKQRAVPAEHTKSYASLMRQARKRLEISASVTNVTEDLAYDSMGELVNFLLIKKQHHHISGEL